MLGFDTLQLDGDLFTRDDISTDVDIAKGAGANLATDAVFVTDPQILEVVGQYCLLTQSPII